MDSTLAEAWAALADYKTYGERDWEGAERAFRRANELNPSLAMNHYHYAWYLALFGRVEEALAEHRRAQELDPLTPLHTTWRRPVWYAEDYERALPLARENVKRYDPGIIAHYVLGETLARMGRYEEAIATHEKLAAIFPRWSYALALTYAAGRVLVRRGLRSERCRWRGSQREAVDPGIIAHSSSGKPWRGTGEVRGGDATREKLAAIFPRFGTLPAPRRTRGRDGPEDARQRRRLNFEAPPPSSSGCQRAARMHARTREPGRGTPLARV